MSCVYVFADESGNFDFSVNKGASKYFILTTVTVPDCSCGHALLDLRRELAGQGVQARDMFHAATDDWPTRTAVLKVIARHPVRIDTTILEKRKAQPSIRHTEDRFYKMAWYLHFKHVAQRIVPRNGELFVIGATIGSKKKKKPFTSAVDDVVSQVSPTTQWRTAGLPAVSDPCLQVADYCSWTVNRKWEQGKDDAFREIAPQVRTEFDVFAVGKTYYY
jgi:hypothetical protein